MASTEPSRRPTEGPREAVTGRANGANAHTEYLTFNTRKQYEMVHMGTLTCLSTAPGSIR